MITDNIQADADLNLSRADVEKHRMNRQEEEEQELSCFAEDHIHVLYMTRPFHPHI